MIASFPNPYAGELFYSICARYSDRMRYSNLKHVMQDLFGRTGITAVVDLPNHLVSFVNALPPGCSFTVDQLIDNHTLLPFYGPFLPRERLERLRQDMTGDQKTSIHRRVGIVPSAVPLLCQLRYCPCCAEEEQGQFDEKYWHCLHQVPGVYVCPKHKVWLEEDMNQNQYIKQRQAYIPANRTISSQLIPRMLENSNVHDILLSIAQDSDWLLHQRNISPGLASLRDRYIKALVERGLATYKGNVHMKALHEQFVAYFPSDTLKFLHCDIVGDCYHSWLTSLLRHSNHVQHPLHHLLLIHFLGYTLQEFFSLDTKLRPFGSGPWPCLNAASSHYRQLRIQDCNISFEKGDIKHPRGVFSCECGFTYFRRGPEVSDADHFRIGKVIQYGKVWEEKLITLWNDPTLTTQCVAKILGVGNRKVKQLAARLGLSLVRKMGNRFIHLTLEETRSLATKHDLNRQSNKFPGRAKIDYYRSEWLAALENYPTQNLKFLRSVAPQAYRWLYFNDWDWLQPHLPKRKKQPIYRVDWKSLDSDLAIEVRYVAASLKESKERPFRISKSVIGRGIGSLSRLEYNLEKLPVTAQALKEVIETREQFAIRRIRWIVSCYLREQRCPKRWEFLRRSGLNPLDTNPAICNAIDEALMDLETRLISKDTSTKGFC